MAANPFQQLHDDLAQALGLPPAPLAPDTQGVRGFTLHWEGRELAVAQVPDPGGDPARDWVALVVEMAPPAPQDAARVLALLLDANFLMLAPGAPVFGRNATNGRLVLRAGLPLEGADATALCEVADHLALLAGLWDQGLLFGPGSPLHGGAALAADFA